MSTANLPAWQVELREHVMSAIKEQVVTNIHDPSFQAVFPTRRSHDYIYTQTLNLLAECWVLFPTWHASYDATHWGGPLTETWAKLSHADKVAVARNFKEFFYTNLPVAKTVQKK